eukprot:Awhi_evm1s5091
MFEGRVFVYPWQVLHSYDFCFGGQNAFSMHFPGDDKVNRMGRVVSWMKEHQSSKSFEKPVYRSFEKRYRNSILRELMKSNQDNNTLLPPSSLRGTVANKDENKKIFKT